MEIFKAYDIRGIYPDELNDEMAYKIGRAFVEFLGCKEVVIGRDMRLSSNKLFEALSKGVTEQGADVIDIGLSSTPMLYFAAHDKQAAIMITASHNPGKYNGFKLCSRNVMPVGEDTGIKDIKKLVLENRFKKANNKGKIIRKDFLANYINFICGFIPYEIRKLKIVLDAGNGMAGYTYKEIIKRIPCVFYPLYFELDGNFPNHLANPLEEENLKDLQKKVKEEKADFGVALDGDGDRCVFVDENGKTIPADIITALIGAEFLKEMPNSAVVYDLRSSKVVEETIKANGGRAFICRVGHSFIKRLMREKDAIFAGELSGHFYYKEHFFTESSMLTMIKLIEIITKRGKQISEIIKPLKKYFPSGEINFEVKDKEAVVKKLEKLYKGKARKVFFLDGITVEFDDWWLNVRPSNTEPLLRLNLEAKSRELMEEKKREITGVIKG